jgi:hypothetical protein
MEAWPAARILVPLTAHRQDQPVAVRRTSECTWVADHGVFGGWWWCRRAATLRSVYEQPRSRRLTPSLVAVLMVLAALAGGGGYLVTRQVLAAQADTAAIAPPSSTRATTSTQPGTAADPGTTCPALTEAAVRAKGLAGGLKLLLYVSSNGTASLAGAEAWVCQNSDNLLIYQGHRRTGPFTDVCCTDTILLGTGIKGRVVRDGDGFIATSPKDVSNPDDPNHTDYHVSMTQFYYVDFPQNAKVTYTIDRSAP